ncbi:citrate/2-methylcitrate synthase [Pseudomonas sp. Mn2068]|uniref:citrate/2-methylcitrate synthase n=1 Tax=Pseudomonas sp. Mn2068 TaxID=3395265 RepID=UPI003BBBAB17
MDAQEEDLYLSADEAASRLGISLPTLYAYVSRKNLRSLKVEGSRSRRYWAADIDRLGKGKEDAGGMPELQRIAASSAITLLTDKGLYYRGRDVVELAQHSSVEEVAQWIWQTPGVFDSTPLPKRPKGIGALLKSLENMTTAQKAIALFPLIEHENPRAHDLSPEGYARTGVDVVRWLAALAVGANGPDARPLHQFIAESLGVDAAFADLIRRALILCIDHELDPTTYTVRVAANVGVTPYYAAIVGLAASRGRRLSTGRSETVTRLLEEICMARDATAPILQRFRQGESIPGFDTNQHALTDPRAQCLLDAMSEVFASDAEFIKLLKAIEVARELTQQPPAFLLLLSFIGRKLNLNSQEVALGGIGRVIGWLAHANEQYQQQPLLRPRAKYVGLLPD